MSSAAALGSLASAPSDSSSTTLLPVRLIAALGPSSWNWMAWPMPTGALATSPSPSVTVTTALTLPARLTASSYELPGVGCLSDRYWATVTWPALLIEMANATAPVGFAVSGLAPPSVPTRPTTLAPSLYRKIWVSAVVD